MKIYLAQIVGEVSYGPGWEEKLGIFSDFETASEACDKSFQENKDGSSNGYADRIYWNIIEFNLDEENNGLSTRVHSASYENGELEDVDFDLD